jgi:STE24 endopeptidase
MRKIGTALFGLLCLISVGAARADTAPDLSLKTAAVSPVDDAWRARLPKDPQAATDAYLARLSPATRARANAYFEGGYWLQLWNCLLSVAILWFLLASGSSARLRDAVERLTKIRFVQGLLFAIGVLTAYFVLSLPLSIYQGFFREHQYGLANQTFLPWMGEQLIGFGVSLVFGGALIAILYLLIRKIPNTWHLWGSLVGLFFLTLMIVIEPVYIDPMFNTYKPLESGATRDAILSMARANGVPASEVYQFDASKQTDRISANVSGVLGTTAIRLNDNLLRRTGLPQIKAVMGHEMGHYVLNHVYKMILEMGILIVLGFAFVRWSFAFCCRRFGARWRVSGIDDLAGLPLAFLLLTVFSFVLTPISNTLIRTQESEADIFGLNAAREPDGFAEATLKLTEYRKPDPGPLEEMIFFDHPSARTRIFSAMRWKAENMAR